MFALLTILTALIAAMFLGLVVSTLRELRQEAVEVDAKAFGKTGR